MERRAQGLEGWIALPIVNDSWSMGCHLGSRLRELPGESVLFPSAAMCYKLSVSLSDTPAPVRVCHRINPDLAGSYDRQTVNSEGMYRGTEAG